MKESKVFIRRINPAWFYFTFFYLFYLGMMLYVQDYQATLVIVMMGLIISGYLYLIRPNKYIIKRHTLIISRRVGKTKEINLSRCEIICNPIVKMTKIICDPHALELYLDNKKKIVVHPKDVNGFCQAVIIANKRINCQVKSYKAIHNRKEK